MITWLLSYPRSGNTWTRIILSRCFGAATYDVYNPRRKIDILNSVVQSLRYNDASQQAFVERARESKECYLIKSHDLTLVDPTDTAVLIVRDGRAAIASYAKFLCDFEDREFPLDALVRGEHWPGSWSELVESSLAFAFARRVVLRYESLDQPQSIAELEQFLSRPRLREFDVQFSDLRAINAAFFNVGRNEPGIAEIESACPDLFWQMHGRTMSALGYGR
jgi:hypothetical protein